MTRSLVTVIVTTYRRGEEFIERTIKSIVHQTHKELEIILVNDNGNDDYDEVLDNIVDKYKNVIEIVYIKNDHNIGACASRNKGIHIANGKYIMYVDDDDELTEKCIETRLGLFVSDNVGLVYSNSYIVDNKGNKKISNQRIRSGKIYNELLQENFIGAFPLIKKECFSKCGLFDEELKASQDYDMWLRIAKEYEVNSTATPLAIVYHHTGERISRDPEKKISGILAINKKYDEDIKLQKKVEVRRQLILIPYYKMTGNETMGSEILKKYFIKGVIYTPKLLINSLLIQAGIISPMKN